MEVSSDVYMGKPTAHVYSSEQDSYKTNYDHRAHLLRMLGVTESLLRRKWIINITFYIDRKLS